MTPSSDPSRTDRKRALRDGEKRQGFEEDALAHLGTLYGVALRLTQNPDEAEDLVQQAVLRAYRGWEGYQRGTNCRAWLLTILKNAFINDFRKRAKHPTSVPYETVEESTVGAGARDGDPEGWFYRHLVDDEVRRAIDELPEEFRTAVVLSDVEDFSYAEIAQAMSVPEGTVKSRLFRGRRRLQRRLYRYAVEMGYVRKEELKGRDGASPRSHRRHDADAGRDATPAVRARRQRPTV